GGREPERLVSWADELNISRFLARILWHRGLSSPRDMDVFLSPGLRHLPPLEKWPELISFAELLAREISRERTLAVWGDYDADGITATAILVHFFKNRGIPVIAHIPERLQQGYGLNQEGLEDLKQKNVDLIITVDCGISNIQEIERARELGLQVFVTDHHLPGKELPGARAMINPCLGNCPYPQAAGAVVAFLLAAALNRILPGEPVDIREYLDLAALGTIADIVELNTTNRILVKNGLLCLGEAKRPGIFALKEICNLPPTAPMGSGQVSFGLAPRINAAGRMGSAQTALQLLLAPDLSTARPLAAQLEKHNQERRRVEKNIIAEASEQAETLSDHLGLVLYSPDWHKGIVGIAASRIVEQFNRPALLLTKDGEKLSGSGRSIAAFDLHQGLQACAQVLLTFGGHRMAAGLSLKEENLDELRQIFNRSVQDCFGDILPPPTIEIDAGLSLGRVDLTLVQELDLLQPFGQGNPQPVFWSPALSVTKHRFFGQNHVSIEVRDGKAGVNMLGKAWRQAETLGPEVKGRDIQLAFTPKLNHYNGLTSIDLQIRDWKEIG
ncbi:MAG: single-stranded-DNA-specific exonuclease RecJ, partial [Desulfohalobiaceae bacterium]|nr:single-stranded-DNA-specific exonuclease RecJ [Desulfohalobiaceae bacterium]